MTATTSTRSPGRTKPLTPDTAFTFMLVARMLAGMRIESPPPIEVSLVARIGSLVVTKTLVVCPMSESWSAYEPGGTLSLGVTHRLQMLGTDQSAKREIGRRDDDRHRVHG